MSKHTPGPWSAHINGSINGNDPALGHETDCSEQGFVAHTVCFGVGDVLLGEVSAYKFSVDDDGGYRRVADFEENIANARLIASAPELLNMVQMIANIGQYRDLVDKMAMCLRAHERAGFEKMFREDAAALIAKATGGAA